MLQSRSSVEEIYAELHSLADVFDNVKIDRRSRTISVTTEPIELDNVYLGPFEIRLFWAAPGFDHGFYYRVVASDPQPAAPDTDVTHPHVHFETLCEGDGAAAIRSALAQARLLDFFQIVTNLLRTYNSSSPYVALESWYGRDCSDCAALVEEGECWSCDKCESCVCSECTSCCQNCSVSLCQECAARCEGCEESYCRGCLHACVDCHDDYCLECLLANERCKSCDENETQEEEAKEGIAGVAIQPGRMGETAVPA